MQGNGNQFPVHSHSLHTKKPETNLVFLYSWVY